MVQPQVGGSVSSDVLPSLFAHFWLTRSFFFNLPKLACCSLQRQVKRITQRHSALPPTPHTRPTPPSYVFVPRTPPLFLLLPRPSIPDRARQRVTERLSGQPVGSVSLFVSLHQHLFCCFVLFGVKKQNKNQKTSQPQLDLKFTPRSMWKLWERTRGGCETVSKLWGFP